MRRNSLIKTWKGLRRKTWRSWSVRSWLWSSRLLKKIGRIDLR